MSLGGGHCGGCLRPKVCRAPLHAGGAAPGDAVGGCAISGKVNLTKNQVEAWGHRSFPAAFQKVQDCGGLFQLMGEYLANAEERKRYRALFRRQALLAKYRAGDRGIWGSTGA